MLAHHKVLKRLDRHKINVFINKNSIDEDDGIVAFTYKNEEYEEYDIILRKTQVNKSAAIELCGYTDEYFLINCLILLIRDISYECEEFYKYSCVAVQHGAEELEDMINNFINK